MADGAVAPELLDYIDDYVEETDFNQAVRSSGLDSESQLIVFYRELFAQLFANVLGEPLLGINDRSAKRANVLYRRHRRDWPPSLRRLVKDFQRLCKIYPDLLGAAYSDGGDLISKLHFDLLPQLLRHLEAWADDTESEALRERASEASQVFADFIDTFEPA